MGTPRKRTVVKTEPLVAERQSAVRLPDDILRRVERHADRLRAADSSARVTISDALRSLIGFGLQAAERRERQRTFRIAFLPGGEKFDFDRMCVNLAVRVNDQSYPARVAREAIDDYFRTGPDETPADAWFESVVKANRPVFERIVREKILDGIELSPDAGIGVPFEDIARERLIEPPGRDAPNPKTAKLRS